MRPRFVTLAALSILFAMRVGLADVTFEFPFAGNLDVQVVSSPFADGAKRLTTIPLPQTKDGGTLLSVNLQLTQFSLDSTIPLTFGSGLLADAYFTADLNGDAIEHLHTEVSCCQSGSAHDEKSGEYLLWGSPINPIGNAPDELDLFLKVNHAGTPGSRSQTAANGKVLATYSSPASEVSWASSSGDWTNSANWSPAIVPSASTSANFRTGSGFAYTVNVQDGSSANNVVVQGDRVSFNLASHNLSAAGNVIVSESASAPGALTVAGPGTLSAAGTVFVGSASSTPATASLTSRGATLGGNVTNYGRLTSLQNSRISGSVTNSGEVRTFTSTTPAEPGNVTTITGDYTQAPGSTLAMQVHGGVTGLKYDQLNISGKANLAGTLDVSVNGAVPAVGDTFPILRYGSVAGRFDKFKGAVIKDTAGQAIEAASHEFFGLLYGADTLNLIALHVPRRPNGQNVTTASKNGLVLLTHGWNSNSDAWAKQVGANIDASNGIRGVQQNWDIAIMDWSEFNGYTGGVIPSMSARGAARNANDIGESLAKWMQEKKFSYQSLHLIGHSAGSWLVNGVNNELRTEGSNAFVHQTYLDAYNPSGAILNGYSAGSVPILGLNANYAEQYYNGLEAPVDEFGLATRLTNAVNYNIRGLLNLSSPLNPHAWPYAWYGDTVIFPTGTDSANGFGFAQSVEFRDPGQRIAYGTPPNGYRKGDVVSLPSGQNYTSITYSESVDLLSLPHIITGDVQPSEGGGLLLSAVSVSASSLEFGESELVISPAIGADESVPTGPATILTAEITLNGPTNVLQVAGQFVSSGHGLLSLYFDGALFSQVDERSVSSDFWNATDLYLGIGAWTGFHTLMLRLDPYDGLDSQLNISDVRFGHAMSSVPEPSCLLMIFIVYGAGLIPPLRQRRCLTSFDVMVVRR